MTRGYNLLNTLQSIRRLKIVDIVWSCRRQGGRKYFIQLPISHCYTLQFVTPNNQCNFFSVLAVKFVGYISEEDVSPERAADDLKWSYFRQYCREFCRTAVFQTFEKLWVLQFCYHVILKDYSLTFIWIEREISVGWWRIVATCIYISVYPSAIMLLDWSHTFPGYDKYCGIGR